ncbi:MAG: 4a-hydroxytetrahydrobiopterin dehydratase [Gammaproteobacteria bacterium]
MSNLAEKKCLPCEGGVPPLERTAVEQLLKQLQGWRFNATKNAIQREFQFKNFYQTMAFVNAIAWIAHQENHHPDLEVSYNHCVVYYSTHAVNGLSENDFICAAKIDRLYS